MLDPSVVNGVRRYLRVLDEHGFTVAFGVVFGSQATGAAGQWSDIDLLVVSPRFDDPVTRADVDRLWHLAVRTDNRIEPMPCGERQWEADTTSALVEIARCEGVRVTPKEEI